MNFSQFLSILRARWWVAVLVLLLTVGSGLGISLLSPKQYTATATLVVDQNRPDPVAAQMYQGNPSPAFMATQVEVLKSERIAREVVSKLELANDAKTHEQWMLATKGNGNYDEWLVERLGQLLDVKPSRESNVISVSFKAPDPIRAAKYANAFVQAYLDVSLKLKVDPAKGYSTFFETQAKEARANLEQAQAKLSAYQKDKGVVVANDGQLDIEAAHLNELSARLVALQALTAESSSRQSQVQSGAANNMPDVISNPVVAGLRSDITQAQARLQELTSRLGDNHPQVIEARAHIASLQGRLDSETRRVAGSFGVSANMNRQREIELRSAIEAQRARVLKIRAARDDGMVLLRELENAQRAYDAILTRKTQSEMESHATQSNGYVLAEAVPPVRPTSPKIVLNTMLSLGVGIVLALSSVVLLEQLDRRVHTLEEIPDQLGLPIFGVLPKPQGFGGFTGGRAQRLSPRGIFGQLPSPSKET